MTVSMLSSQILRVMSREIIRINKQRWEIEENFRIMKTEFEARPVYVQREMTE